MLGSVSSTFHISKHFKLLLLSLRIVETSVAQYLKERFLVTQISHTWKEMQRKEAGWKRITCLDLFRAILE